MDFKEDQVICLKNKSLIPKNFFQKILLIKVI
jgi:hypothetical protein